ncbi:peroxiredoxin Q [Auriscalpium vulgare]|uniref:Peroxiredoxin Q n=1 Tax=Auriscalpium vulgare TaxID=40419 RepID=A0ACB8S494_9AGAM|nr:peroxiredoxin Q [Auriscalpium vulgare]
MVQNTLVGQPAPALSLKNYDGSTYEFPGTSGRPIALFFFPRAGSYGCTKEVCSFRDALVDQATFKNSNVTIVGVSPDTPEDLKAFAAKQNVTYPILSDQGGEARQAYHVGKALFGLAESARVTFVIDQSGVVRDALDSTINFGAHVKFVSKWLETLPATEASTTDTAPAPTPASATT